MPLLLVAGGGKQPTDTFVYNGHLAVDCLPFDTTEPCMEQVKQVGRLRWVSCSELNEIESRTNVANNGGIRPE